MKSDASRRVRAGAALALFAMLEIAFAGTAHARPPDTDRPRADGAGTSGRRGLYAMVAPFTAYGVGTYRYDAIAEPVVPDRAPAPLHFVARVSGPAFGLEGALGHSLTRDLALALLGGAGISPVGTEGDLGWTSIDAVTTLRGGALADWWPAHAAAAHVQLGAAVSFASFSYATAAIGAEDNVVNPESVAGPWGFVAVVYDLYQSGPFTLGARARFSTGYLSSGASSYVPTELGASVALGWF